MSCASQTRASRESAAVSAERADADGAGGGFGGIPCAARGRTGAKKISPCNSMRVLRFEISKAVLRFPPGVYLTYGHLTRLQRCKANVLHTNMRGAGTLRKRCVISIT